MSVGVFDMVQSQALFTKSGCVSRCGYSPSPLAVWWFMAALRVAAAAGAAGSLLLQQQLDTHSNRITAARGAPRASARASASHGRVNKPTWCTPMRPNPITHITKCRRSLDCGPVHLAGSRPRCSRTPCASSVDLDRSRAISMRCRSPSFIRPIDTARYLLLL